MLCPIACVCSFALCSVHNDNQYRYLLADLPRMRLECMRVHMTDIFVCFLGFHFQVFLF